MSKDVCIKDMNVQLFMYSLVLKTMQVSISPCKDIFLYCLTAQLPSHV